MSPPPQEEALPGYGEAPPLTLLPGLWWALEETDGGRGLGVSEPRGSVPGGALSPTPALCLSWDKE